jgi:hypothetical protein
VAPPEPVDLTDLDNFANGFPHEVFTWLRREKPVFFHQPTERTSGDEGFWVLTRHADVLGDAVRRLDEAPTIEPAGPPEWTRTNKHTGVRHLPMRLTRA